MTQGETNGFHRKSVTWNKAMELTVKIYELTRAFPSDERFGLTNQLRRAAVSIPSNIAEGNGRLNTREFVQFLGIARGSTLEVLTQLELANALGFSKGGGALLEAEQLATEVLKLLNATITTLQAKGTTRRP